jgi:hypothetical protein
LQLKKIAEYSAGILWSTSTCNDFVILHCTKQAMLIEIENSSKIHHNMKVSVRMLNVTSATSFSGDRAWNVGTETYESKWYILVWCSRKQLWGRIVSMVTRMEHTASRIFTVACCRTTEQIAGASSCVPYCLFKHSTQVRSWPFFLIYYRQRLLHMQFYSSFKSMVARSKFQQRHRTPSWVISIHPPTLTLHFSLKNHFNFILPAPWSRKW